MAFLKLWVALKDIDGEGTNIRSKTMKATFLLMCFARR